MNKKFLFFLAISILLTATTTPCTDAIENALSLEDILSKIQTTQAQIKDMKADMTTTITSTIQGAKKIVQKGRILTKAPDKSKIEMFSPIKQITITNRDKMCVINPDTGQKIVQDLSELREQTGIVQPSGPMDATKALEYFDLEVRETENNKEYIITGTPKGESKFLGKMDFFIDAERWVPTRIAIYNSNRELITLSEIEYKKISDIWVSYKNKSTVTLPNGSMNVEMTFENIQVNEGISDEEFEI